LHTGHLHETVELIKKFKLGSTVRDLIEKWSSVGEKLWMCRGKLYVGGKAL